MMAPFIDNIFGWNIGYVITVFLGFGFGFVLERAGFGSSRILASQFYLNNMRVFKVMFSAIITAMIGLFGLSKLGVVNLSMVYINPTHIWPQLIGGLLLGAGFILSGYCPGTSLVASVSGKFDAMLTVAGVVAGIFTFGLFSYIPGFEEFHKGGILGNADGRFLLSDLFGIDPTMLTLIIVVFAATMFLFAEWVERLYANKYVDAITEKSSPKVRYAVLGTLVFVAALFALPFSEITSPPVVAYSQPESLDAVAVARKIIDDGGLVQVIDTRSEEAREANPFKTARAISAEDLSSRNYWLDNLSPQRYYVLVGEADADFSNLQIPASYSVGILTGGYDAWKAGILSEPVLPEKTTSAALEEYRIKQSLYAFFTNAKVEAPTVAAPPAAASGGGARKKKPSGGC